MNAQAEKSSLSHGRVDREVRKVRNLETDGRGVILEEKRFLFVGPDTFTTLSVNSRHQR
jgi:hypothetical protein